MMRLAATLCVAMFLASAGLSVASVWLLAGTPWAMLAGSVWLLAAALVMVRGMSHG